MAQFQSTYNPETALAICERIAEGETLSAVCSEKGMPARTTFHRWVVRYPELSRAYAAARELSAYSLEEEALDAARLLKDARGKKKLSQTEVRALDVAMGQLRWSAARRNPRVFSERGAINVTVPIQINTTLPLGDAGDEGQGSFRLEATVQSQPEPEMVSPAEEMVKEGVGPLLPQRERLIAARKAQKKWMAARNQRPKQEEAGNAQDAGEGSGA